VPSHTAPCLLVGGLLAPFATLSIVS
jgi:hypothetical protein